MQKQIIFPFYRVALYGGQPMSRAELRKKRREINKKAAALEAAAKVKGVSHGDDGGTVEGKGSDITC